MERTQYKSLALILARDLAENLATPIFVVDATGALVFYNEPAEHILGQRFAETGELPAAEWASIWVPTEVDGSPMQIQDMPIGIALQNQRPAHRSMRIKGLDGVSRLIQVSAFPLLASPTEFSGAVAIFWEEPE
ncbi:MAG TPA: PAS domain-containing protein [Actinomycetota bacterium]|nr:PAS domain-containing protein [Actinomycetota bacterium]